MSSSRKSIKIGKATRSRKGLSGFSFTDKSLPEVEDSSLRDYRQSAWEAYQSLSFPTKLDEPWRRTDISQLKTESFSLFKKSEKEQQLPRHVYDPKTADDLRSGQIIAGAGVNDCSINRALEDKGVIFEDFHTAEIVHPRILQEVLGQIVSPGEDKFTALAAALATDGVFLYVPKNVTIEDPLHSIYWGMGESKAFINHLVIWLEEGAQATIVHESTSPNGVLNEQLFHNGIVEIHVGNNAHLNLVELQSWGKNVWSFTRERAQVMADGKLDWVFGAMGSHLSKNFLDIDLVEPGAQGRMSGFYFTDDDQHLDLDTQQNHLAAHTTSDLLFRGALMDASRSVWQGMVYVAPGAVGTDGYQANRNLILSKAARADSIPGLEILADDVRCSHGATVGKIDEDEIFYLLSRGIPQKEAEQLIILGFFNPIMERIPFTGVRQKFIDAIIEKMNAR